MKTLNTLTLLATLSVFTTTVYADQQNFVVDNGQLVKSESLKKEENINSSIGFGGGAVVGAVIGGPVGAVIGGIAGSLIAVHYNTNEEAELVSQQLVEETEQHHIEMIALNNKLNKAEQNYQQELLLLSQQYQEVEQLQAENLLLSLQFSTGSSQIKPHYHEQLSALANILTRADSMKIDLSGFTDLQGDEAANEVLSWQRVDAVKQALTSLGINEDRITTSAFGEQRPVVASQENEISFYDRRVVIKLLPNQSQTAKLEEGTDL
ncbi:sortase-associated OmpA-like protein PdsO [Thalassotalea agarivorans]|uniref:Sortase system peptidoglycan-associated protein n=1 Tax=Thalassotalea agarivorans TaxID=349064 RepID=A0A1I0DGE0_THASX|nr:sortase-associated OmpA-like protein PdsO [Thalassotalea agarivorans]SET30692.1 sortase system peptidoglycan-associated protein [Thalassotalea agarivorans]